MCFISNPSIPEKINNLIEAVLELILAILIIVIITMYHLRLVSIEQQLNDLQNRETIHCNNNTNTK